MARPAVAFRTVLFDRDLQGGLGRHDAQLLAGVADQAHFLVADLLVDLMSRACYARTPPGK